MDVPDSDLEAYVAHFDVEDENDDEKPKFVIKWTTKKLLNRI